MSLPMTLAENNGDSWFEVSQKHLPAVAEMVLSYPYTALKGYDPCCRLRDLAQKVRDMGASEDERSELIERLSDLRVVGGVDRGLRLKIT